MLRRPFILVSFCSKLLLLTISSLFENLAHLNARSLKGREHFILVKETILENRFDVFTVSETWLDDSVPDLTIEIPGYHLFRIDRQKRGGGVCKTELLPGRYF